MSSRAAPRAVLAVVLALGALLAAPSLAAAGGEPLLEARLEGSHGYWLTIRGHGQTVSLTTSHAAKLSQKRGSYAVYLVRGKVGAGSIRASFPGFGSVALRFHRGGRVTHGKPQRGCFGPDRTTAHHGYFTGAVSFRGEGGYTVAHAHRVKGASVTPSALNCAPPKSTGQRTSEQAKRTSIAAGWKLGLDSVRFLAATDRTHGARYIAASEHSEGQIAIYRVAYTRAAQQSFTSDMALSSASLSPPAPFSGTGNFQRGPHGNKIWTGTLAVSFPGEPSVALTGPEFRTQLNRTW